MKTENLETVDIPDVEILAVGKWKGNKEVTIPKEAILAFVESFDELTANDKLNYEPPVKLGHDENQKILQADGYPAAGWIGSLKTKGDKLVASFKAVPKKLAEVIKAGGYKKVSAEFYQDYEIGGKKYPWVLKAVSLLGADVPAVKTIADIQAMYSEQNEPEPVIVFAELAEDMSLDKKAQTIRESFYAQTRNPLDRCDSSWITEVYPNFVIFEKGAKLYKIPYSESGTDIIFDTQNAIEVKKNISYDAVQPAETPAASAEPNKNTETEVSMELDKELRGLLKLDEKADVLEAVRALVNKPEAVSLVEYTATKNEVTKLKETIALKERDERVSKAISAGKVTPAQKAWADAYALKDPAGFDAFVIAAPKVIELGERGSGDGPAVELTEVEIKIGEKLGLTKEDMVNAKKQGGNS